MTICQFYRTKRSEKWKKELLFNGEVGPPCSEDYVKWGEDNPDVYYGLPKKIDHKTSDFNNDGKDDFLLYFSAKPLAYYPLEEKECLDND